MTEKQIEPGKDQLKNELDQATYSAHSDLDRYYERVIKVQAKKIEFQAQELARMNRVYMRSVRSTKISEAVKFLISIIFNKIKK